MFYKTFLGAISDTVGVLCERAPFSPVNGFTVRESKVKVDHKSAYMVEGEAWSFYVCWSLQDRGWEVVAVGDSEMLAEAFD